MNTKEIDKVLDNIGEEVAKIIEQKVPKSSGELKKSIGFKVKKSGKKFEVDIIMAEYGAYVNDGTKPHKVSAEKLKKWASKHNLNPYAVANKIKKYGTKGKKFLPTDQTINNIVQEEDFSTFFESEMDKIIKKIK